MEFQKFHKITGLFFVRGLAEQEVDADLAVWKMSYSVGQNDLSLLQKNLDSNNKVILDFLNQYNLSQEEISVLAPEINDVTTNIYLDTTRRAFNYVAKQSILIRSSKIQNVMEASKNTTELLGKGIAISSDYDNKVNYYFNGLNQTKNDRRSHKKCQSCCRTICKRQKFKQQAKGFFQLKMLLLA